MYRLSVFRPLDVDVRPVRSKDPTGEARRLMFTGSLGLRLSGEVAVVAIVIVSLVVVSSSSFEAADRRFSPARSTSDNDVLGLLFVILSLVAVL